jgi:hypothetical protein
MEHVAENTFHRVVAWLLLLSAAIVVLADDGGTLGRRIQLPKSKESIYKLLRQVSDKSGYLFIYDSRIIDNDKVVKVAKGEYTVREAIQAITGDKQLKISVIGNHILLQLPERAKIHASQPLDEADTLKTEYFTSGGAIHDRITGEPLAYSTIGVNNTTVGTISNQDGEFELILPDSLRRSIVKFTHVGYESREIEAELMAGQHIRFALEPRIIPLQEVVVRAVDPRQEINLMLQNRKNNYSSASTYHTTFYREGTDHKRKNIDVTESVLKVYKTGYQGNMNSDQVKLIKMRRIRNVQESDTIFTKMKSGINSCLMLDIMKNLPEFIRPEEQEKYDYVHTDITVMDGRRVNIISFSQKEYISEPLFKGQLYIDAEKRALVEARFEINPKYAGKATDIYVERKHKDLKLTLQQVRYTVSYKTFNDSIYYINHIRGDLEFKVKKKRKLFSTPLHLWFEMVNCKVDTGDVNNFPKEERLPTRDIFSDTKHTYDQNFWGRFNVILPEEKLKELIINNLSEVSE